MSQMTGYWKLIAPATRKELYTAVVQDPYDPRGGDRSTMASVSWFSQLMKGPGSRMASYRQYDAMDTDVDIARSLDIIAEEMSGKDEKTGLPFEIEWQKEDNQDISDTTIVTVRAALRQFAQLQDLKRRIRSTARHMVKYGDCFFRKVSDTKKWQPIDPMRVVGIHVDEEGNKIAYEVKKFSVKQANSYGSANVEETETIPAAAMIHFTMADDMGDSAIFGQSILRSIMRVYRQLTMLEDAIMIYKIVRAPERRVFYIDVGNMNQTQIKRYLESIKIEMRQKRVPGTQTSGYKDNVDGQLDPMSMQEDYFFPVTAGGKGGRVETLPGGSEDFGTTLLREFTMKISRGLRIPTSYMGAGSTAAGGETPAQYNDGKVGIAYIEELRFAKFIMHLQERLNDVYDQEFKIYLKVCGLMVDDEVFNIRLPDPANFALYRQAALDADLINAFKNIEDTNLLSRRLILKRYLGLTDDEIQMNEVQLKEERNLKENSKVPMLQQLYDKNVKFPIVSVDPNDTIPEPGEGGDTGEFGGEDMGGAPTGLLSSEGDNPPADNSAGAEAPAEETPAEETPAGGEETA